MSEIEKFFKLFDKKENIESFLETEKENTIFKSVSFMKKILKVLIKDNKLECNHSIEDICAYFENNLSKDEKEKIKERIFSCDSCFNTYNYLKSQIKLEKVKTPNTLLDKVLMGGTSFLFDIFNSLKTSNLKLSLGASFALIIAVMFSLPMFYTSQKNLDVMPANESKLDLSTAKKDKESFKISQSLQKPKPQEPSVLSRSVSPLATVKSEKIFIPKQVYTKHKVINFEKILQKKDEKPLIEKKYNDTITSINNISKRTLDVKKEAQKELTQGLSNFDSVVKPLVKERFAMSTKALERDENKFKSAKNEDKFAMSEVKKSDEVLKEESLKDAESPKVGTLKQDNIILSAPTVALQAKSLSEIPKSESENKFTINNISLEKDGFIVIYEKTGEKLEIVLGTSEYLKAGFYKKVEITSEKDLKKSKIIAILYHDSNNNKKFDITDTIIRSIDF